MVDGAVHTAALVSSGPHGLCSNFGIAGEEIERFHVYRMGGKQAARSSDAEREAYAASVLKKNYQPPGERWYADSTREPIRDETLRDGLVAIGAVIRRKICRRRRASRGMRSSENSRRYLIRLLKARN